MSVELWIAFVFTASLILVIPGPTIIYVVGQSLVHGRKAGIPLSIGVILGDALCITLSLVGLGTLLSFFSTAFLIVKYLGAAYLVYLGVKMIKTNSHIKPHQPDHSAFNSKTLFRDVFWVNALNPKGIIFYSAFMPQFITTQSSIPSQLILLSGTFLCLALINVTLYSLLASKASEALRSTKFTKAFNLTGGISLICAGIYSATVERK